MVKLLGNEIHCSGVRVSSSVGIESECIVLTQSECFAIQLINGQTLVSLYLISDGWA